MKVKELKLLLFHMDPEAEVILAGDPEGNYFRAAEGHSTGWWDAERKEIKEAKQLPLEGRAKAVVLWP